LRVPLKLVLDTNVWIDWLVFNDPGIAPLSAAHRDGRVTIAIDDACLQELEAVLAYTEFQLSDVQQDDHLKEAVRCTLRYNQRSGLPSPRCSDPDDQKFLTLALDAAADWLLTRDNALLRLNRRLEARGCRIGSPAQWSVAHGLLHSTQVVDSSSPARAVR
jgi:putative PIN family toxin of toxin-antitoxin system